MSGDNQLVIDLNESLYFESGQEISEMLNISLDPNISVQSLNDSVLIRGKIELQGEYQKSATAKEEEPLELEDYHSRRYVEKVEDTSEEIATFSHAFPIEISVPSDRVEDLNHIMVNVKWFDYDLPNDNQLTLTSQIAIEGISQLRQELKEEESVDESLDFTDRRHESFEFEIKQPEEADETDVNQVGRNTPKISEQPLISDEDDFEQRENDLSSQSIANFFTRSLSYTKEDNLQDEMVDERTDESVAYSDAEESIDRVEEDLEESRDEDHQEELNDVSYLADMFKGREEEMVEFTQLRICIVQEDDTLETIAERYDIPKLQLLKQNRLEGDDLTEGQLLSIPVRKSKQQS